MTTHRAQVEELLADYHRSREQLASVHCRLGAVSATESSDDGLVTATVSARGVLTGLVIADSAYERYRPAELAAQIVRVAGAATVTAFTDASELLTPVLPSGTDPQALLLGTADLAASDVAPEATAEDAADAEEFADHNWLDDSEWSRPR